MMLDVQSHGEVPGEGPKILQSKVISQKKPDPKQKVQLIFLVVLLCVFFYLIKTTFFKPHPNHAPVEAAAQASSGVPANSAGNNAPQLPGSNGTHANKDDGEGWGRSPFSLVAQSDDKKGPMGVQGIVADGVHVSYAIINQKIVKVGDRIDDKKVKKISQGEVVLATEGGEEVVLKG